jgi:hypothetical protein
LVVKELIFKEHRIENPVSGMFDVRPTRKLPCNLLGCRNKTSAFICPENPSGLLLSKYEESEYFFPYMAHKSIQTKT